MKPSASLPLATGLAALAVGASVLLSASEAKAICLGPSTPCSLFNPGSPTSPTFVYAGSSTTSGNPYNKVRVGFRLANATLGLPLNISGITLAGDGLTGNQSFSPVSVASNGNPITWTAPFSISNRNSINFNNSVLNFSFPAGLNEDGAALTAFVQYGNGSFDSGNGDDVTARNLTTTSVPGPLPLLGAASAFGFSRSVRRRIKAQAAA